MNKAPLKAPLNGVRVLDLTRVLAGPYAGILLSDLGAEVIKIEEPEAGDTTRGMGPKYNDGQSAYFISVNRGKLGLTLDIKKGLDVFYDLVRVSDVVLDNFRPRVIEKLKIDYNSLKKINTRIISCSISAFGENGPYRDLPAFDLSIQAMGGGMSITGEEGRPPVRMGIPIGDLAGGIFAAYGIVTALFERERTGEGRRIDISLLDCQVSLLTYVAQYFLADGKVPAPIGSGHQTVVPYQAFRTKDSYIVIAIITEKFWAGLCRVLGLDTLSSHPDYATNEARLKNRDKLIQIIQAEFLKKATDEWLSELRKEGIPSAPVNTLDRTLSDPQVLFRNMVLDIKNQKGEKIKVIGNPVKMQGVDDIKPTPAPYLGEHTEMLLKRILKYSDEKIKILRENGII